MGLHLETGTITRALPSTIGLNLKLQRGDGSTADLDVPANRPDLVDAARAARMSGRQVTLRRTDAGMVVTLTIGEISIAA